MGGFASKVSSNLYISHVTIRGHMLYFDHRAKGSLNHDCPTWGLGPTIPSPGTQGLISVEEMVGEYCCGH